LIKSFKGQESPLAVQLPNTTAESAEYEAILVSASFAGETNSKRFLKFVCDRYFAGINHISEYEIAVEALGRRADFDPALDSIVRVEAHRVRRKLKEIYDQEGEEHSLRLVLPLGSYLPQFIPAGHPGAESHEFSHPSEQDQIASFSPSSLRRLAWNLSGFRAALLILACAGSLGACLAAYLHMRTKAADFRSVAPAAAAVPAAAVTLSDMLIMAGSSASNYTDQVGHVWSPDRFFDGGQSWKVRYRRILRTLDPQLFLNARQGEDFGYDVPLTQGLYELRLYFAETFYGEDNSEGGGESSRIFDVFANGEKILSNFDPLSDAGGSNTADVRVFAGIAPAADGKLHLRFRNHWQLKGVAFVNAIQLSRTDSQMMQPIRWVTADSAVEDREGRLWLPDQFVQGGRRRELDEPVGNSEDPELFKSERYGNFTYAVPVISDGTYTLTLYFAEHWFGTADALGESYEANIGARVFDVYCNGVSLLQDFDIYKESGGALKAMTKTFHGLRPNHQGKILLSFVPNHDYATVSALEIVEEGKK
jgi:hypothetical protein